MEESIKQPVSLDHSTIEEVLKKAKDAKLFLDLVGVMIIVLDSEGVIRFVNQEGCEILGCDERAILGANWFERFVPKNEAAAIKEVFSNLMAGNTVPFEYFENNIIDKAGNTRIIGFHNTIIKDKAGVIGGIVFAGQDMTVQKKTSKSLAKQEAFNEIISDNLPIGYCVNTISDGRVVSMNKKFEEIYGWPRTVLTDIDAFFNHVYPDLEFRKKLREQVMMDIMSAEPARMIWKNLPIVKQSGEAAYITAQNVPLYEYDLMVSTVIDVTHEVKMEKSLRDNERLQRAILDTIQDLAWIKDKNGVILFVNAALEKAFSRPGYQLVGKSMFDIWNDRSISDPFLADDAQVISSGKQLIKKEYIPIPGTDKKVFVEVTKMPIYNEDGSVFGVTGIARILEQSEK